MELSVNYFVVFSMCAVLIVFFLWIFWSRANQRASSMPPVGRRLFQGNLIPAPGGFIFSFWIDDDLWVTDTMNQTSFPSSGQHRQVPCLLSGAMSLAHKHVAGQEGTVSTKTGNIPSWCVTCTVGYSQGNGSCGVDSPQCEVEFRF